MIHEVPFGSDSEAMMQVGEPHADVTGHEGILTVTFGSLDEMLFDIYNSKNFPDTWKLGLLRTVASQA